MVEEEDTIILYRNDQWMVQNFKGGVFIVEVLNVRYDDLDPEADNYQELYRDRRRQELEGGYWIPVRDLAHLFPDSNWGTIGHVCEKTWVDIDALELATLHALLIAGVRPSYDVGEQFKKARQRKARWERRDRGPKHISECVLELFEEEAELA